jgi:glycosyltransferase involved in cell wall biosynthesis
MNQPKIAHITTIDQSLEYLLLHQLCSLQRAGYRVAGISTPGSHVPTIEAAGIRHIPVPITRNLTPLTDLLSLWRLYRVMRRERFIIVHTHNPKPGLLGQLAARLARVPVVVNTVHGFYFHEYMHPLGRRFYIILERLAARCSDVIFSQNEEDIKTAIRERICPPQQIKYLGNGIDLTWFDRQRFSASEIAAKRAELGLAPDAPIVGFVGRLALKRKGFLAFLMAAKRVAEQVPGVRFLIIGETDYGKPDAIESSAARDYGVEEACLFLGQQPNRQLPLLYSLMDVLVLPSLFEGLPRVVMEASAMQVPAVVSDVKGNREAVEQGRNGLLVPLNDVAALSEAIVAILSDPEKARSMGEQGRQVAEERFDEQLVFDQVKAEYARLLQAKGLPVPDSAS